MEAQRLLDEIRQTRAKSDEVLKAAEAARAQIEAEGLGESKRLLEEMKLVRARAEEFVKGAEQDRTRAGSEALLAVNAKAACEEHATAIAAIRGAVDSNSGSVLANKQKSDELLAAVNTAKASTEADSRVISSARGSAEADLKAIDDRRKEVDAAAQALLKAAEAGGSRLPEIDAAKAAAETASKATAASQDGAAQARSATDAAQKQAEKLASEAQQLVAAITLTLNNSKQLADAISALLQASEKADAEHKKIWEHLEKSDQISVSHEQKVAAHSTEIQELVSRLEGLLPGATSAGLASSFNKQRERFANGQRLWLATFVACIVLLILVGLPGFFQAVGWHPLGGAASDPTWNTTWRSLTMRLPIVLPLVWLGIYAGRNYMLSLRLEEDYAYKEAISAAFEGYKREMEKIGAVDRINLTPVATLCTNVLRAIAERPGRIYEGKQEDINLLNEAITAAQKVSDLSMKKIAEK